VHVVASAAWIGGAFFLEFAFDEGLAKISSAQRVALATSVATRFTYVAWLSLVAISATGLTMTYLRQGLDLTFLLSSSQGLILTIGMALTLAAIGNGLVISFILRPRLASKDPDIMVAASRTSARLVRLNTGLGGVAIVLMVLFAQMIHW
jgi:uncharacterized membrane protein